MAIKKSGKTPRITAKSFADRIGVDVSTIKNYQKMAKSYNDAARKWAARYNYEGQLWRPWSITAMSRSSGSRTPEEAFLYAYDELTQRLLEGVSATLTAGIKQYAVNVMNALAQSDDFLLDQRLQDLFDRWQRGSVSDAAIFRALGGQPLRAFYTSKNGVSGDIDIDFNPMIDALETAGLL